MYLYKCVLYKRSGGQLLVGTITILPSLKIAPPITAVATLHATAEFSLTRFPNVLTLATVEARRDNHRLNAFALRSDRRSRTYLTHLYIFDLTLYPRWTTETMIFHGPKLFLKRIINYYTYQT